MIDCCTIYRHPCATGPAMDEEWWHGPWSQEQWPQWQVQHSIGLHSQDLQRLRATVEALESQIALLQEQVERLRQQLQHQEWERRGGRWS